MEGYTLSRDHQAIATTIALLVRYGRIEFALPEQPFGGLPPVLSSGNWVQLESA